MFNHTLAQHESLGTVDASMFSDAQVPFQMDAEVHPSLECPSACVAFRWMSRHMHIVCTNTVERHFTHFAHVITVLQNFEQCLVFVFCAVTGTRFQCRPIVAQQIIVETCEWSYGFGALFLTFDYGRFGWFERRAAGRTGYGFGGFFQFHAFGGLRRAGTGDRR